MKKNNILRKIKWENIVCLLLTCLFTYQLIYHIILNGFKITILIELVMQIMTIVCTHYLIKDMRKNPSNW